MEETKLRVKRAKKADLQLELLQKLSEKLNSLEAQVKERDEKLQNLEKKAVSVETKAQVGVQKFGKSEWSRYEHGREKGYQSSYYVDVHSLMKQQYYGE